MGGAQPRMCDGRAGVVPLQRDLPLRNNLYVVGTNGKGKRRLTKGEGTYAIAPSEGCKYYISYFSNSSTPNTVTLHDSRGRLLRTLEDNAELKGYIASVGYPVREFFTFPLPTRGVG